MTERLLWILSHIVIWAVGLAVAAVLTLSWALRGAPIGQAAEEETDEDAPGASYRDKVVAKAVAGLLLIAVGAYVAVAISIPGSLACFAAGCLTIQTQIRANRKYRHASPSLRRVVDVLNSAQTAGLLGGVLVVGNVLAFKYGGRSIDFTHDRAYSLASLSVNQLKALDRPTSFTLVFGESPGAREQFDRVWQLLGLFKAENPGKVKVASLNPYSDPQRFDDLRKLAADLAVAVTQGGGVLIESGEGHVVDRTVVRNAELFEIGSAETVGGESGRFVSNFKGEDALISALARLRAGKKSLVAFITGHGEPSIHDLEPTKPGLGLIRSKLEGMGARVVVEALARDGIDPGVELAIIAGPRAPFQTEELDRLKRYLDKGGHLLILLGYARDDAEKTGLEEWLKGYDVDVGPGVVLDRSYNFAYRPELIQGLVLGTHRHPIVESLANRRSAVPYAIPVKAAARPANPNVTVTPILQSSPESWIRTDLTVRRPIRGENETAGPVDLAVAVADRAAGPGGGETPRLVVIGSRQAADNPFTPYNFDLIVNAVNWLRGRPEQRGAIAARSHTALTLAASPQLRAKIVLIPTLIAFSVIVGFGVATYLARRS